MKIKKIVVCAMVTLSIFGSMFAQESVSEEASTQEEQLVIKFNVIDPDLKPKIYVAKNSNFIGKKLIATGPCEVSLDKSDKYGYIGFSKTAVQRLNFDSNFLEYNVEGGNPSLHKLGVAGTVVGSVLCGVGLGFAMIGVMDGDNSMLLPMGGMAVGGLGLAIGGFVISEKHKPKLILLSN